MRVIITDGLCPVNENTPENQSIINTSVFDPGGYGVPPCDDAFLRARKAYPSAYIKRASIFSMIGERELAVAEAEQALRIMPDCPAASRVIQAMKGR